MMMMHGVKLKNLMQNIEIKLKEKWQLQRMKKCQVMRNRNKKMENLKKKQIEKVQAAEGV